MPSDISGENKAKKGAATLSIITNAFLAVSKIVTGLCIGSMSIISEGIHSGIDLLGSIIAFFSVR
ncbi:MAG TPA: cation transporter, partial [Methanocorpusculum sp.]|nr:cation transporter [Methanocorpusculum sp.]